ncbi:alpha/beta-hydrolase [Setomelanomma holmii]|uniref:Alpha/beta-hydrolase n=1 Tax=Setomelanomma holmii TaxID=210430 RepID=A0A9P4LUJ0_9PLEO|nr:alpha/beta-hydrolase [Setomelanomma holmii]
MSEQVHTTEPHISPQSSTQDCIWHTTLGSPSNPPLLLLHGIFCSHLEFFPLIPFLQPHFYVILVDLSGHSRSRSPTLSTQHIPEITSTLASLIRSVSPTGSAHVAGLSYGGFVGLELARRHPDVVLSLFASGAPPFEGKERFFASRPRLLYCVIASTNHIPDSLYWWFSAKVGVQKHAELRAESKRNLTFVLLKQGYGDVLEITLKEVGEVGVRTLAVAGGRQDSVDVTRRMGTALRGKGGRAVVVRKAIHAWDLQFPELFAEGVRRWIQEEELPEEYEELL